MAGRGTGGRARRRSAAAAALVASVALGGVWTLGGGAPVDASEASPVISVSEVPSTVELGPCSAGTSGLRYETRNSADAFTLRIVALTAPCSPIAATAVAYRMPDDGSAWPQTLFERRDLGIERAGVTDVRFAKGCVPLQFDVVTGATPTTIAPWAQWHGPLLFPGDITTAWQHRPAADCTPGTTSSTTVTPTSAVPTTTGATSTTVAATSTSALEVEDEVTSTSTSAPSVLGTTQTPPDTPEVLSTTGGRTTPQVAGLALTGTPARLMALVGLAAVLLGLVVLWGGSGRRAD